MSQTQQAAPPSGLDDTYLMSQVPPQQDIVLEKSTKFTGIRMVTPVGRLSFVKILTATAINNTRPDDKKFSCSIVLAPNSCADLWKAACMVADDRWPTETIADPSDMSRLIQVRGSDMLRMPQLGFHNPLRDGNQIYAQAPQKYGLYRGMVAINCGTGEKFKPLAFNENNQPCPPEYIYSGCYGALQITVMAFWPKPGQQGASGRGVTMYLNGVRLVRHGEKLSGFDAIGGATKAFAVFGTGNAGTSPGGAPPGFGPNYGAPPPGVPAGFAAPVGGAPPGFAAPPAQPYPAQPQAQATYTPPQQPGAAPVGGAPPGFAAAPAQPGATPYPAQPQGQPQYAPPQQPPGAAPQYAPQQGQPPQGYTPQGGGYPPPS